MSELLTGIASLTKSVQNTLNSYEIRKISDKVSVLFLDKFIVMKLYQQWYLTIIIHSSSFLKCNER